MRSCDRQGLVVFTIPDDLVQVLVEHSVEIVEVVDVEEASEASEAKE